MKSCNFCGLFVQCPGSSGVDAGEKEEEEEEEDEEKEEEEEEDEKPNRETDQTENNQRFQVKRTETEISTDGEWKEKMIIIWTQRRLNCERDSKPK